MVNNRFSELNKEGEDEEEEWFNNKRISYEKQSQKV
jgi:hypothetical protein